MNAADEHGARAQHRFVERWVASLTQLPGVETIWLEGSLVDDRANPWSDVDLRVALADDAYEQLWMKDQASLLQGVGEYLLLVEGGFVRALTAGGFVIELLALKSSEIGSLELYEWKLLFDCRPGGPPAFRKLPARSTAETWPGPPVSVDDIHSRTKFALYMMAMVSSDLYRGEACAAAWTLELLRDQLRQVMYQRLGIRFSKRAKEVSQIFPPEFIADLRTTYTEAGPSPLDLAASATALIRTFAVLGKHLLALSDQAGGGFEPEWYGYMFEKLKLDLREYVSGEGGSAS